MELGFQFVFEVPVHSRFVTLGLLLPIKEKKLEGKILYSKKDVIVWTKKTNALIDFIFEQTFTTTDVAKRMAGENSCTIKRSTSSLGRIRTFP